MPILADEKELYVVAPADHEEEISYRNPVRELGFAQIEHILGLDTDLSDGAYRTLSILHYFWQQKKSAFPSIKTLAKLRGKSERTIGEHLAELTEKGIISRERRMGTSAMTYLEDLPQDYQDAARAILEERKAKRKKLPDDLRKTADSTCEKLPIRPAKNCRLRITNEEEQEEEAPGGKMKAIRLECWQEFQSQLESRGEIYGATRSYQEWQKTWEAYGDCPQDRHKAGMAELSAGKSVFKYFDAFRGFKPPAPVVPVEKPTVQWVRT